jgi:hypothetical protein
MLALPLRGTSGGKKIKKLFPNQKIPKGDVNYFEAFFVSLK